MPTYQRRYLGGGGHLRTGDKLGDPLFRDMAKADFHLLPDSAAVVPARTQLRRI